MVKGSKKLLKGSKKTLKGKWHLRAIVRSPDKGYVLYGKYKNLLKRDLGYYLLESSFVGLPNKYLSEPSFVGLPNKYLSEPSFAYFCWGKAMSCNGTSCNATWFLFMNCLFIFFDFTGDSV